MFGKLALSDVGFRLTQHGGLSSFRSWLPRQFVLLCQWQVAVDLDRIQQIFLSCHPSDSKGLKQCWLATTRGKSAWLRVVHNAVAWVGSSNSPAQRVWLDQPQDYCLFLLIFWLQGGKCSNFYSKFSFQTEGPGIIFFVERRKQHQFAFHTGFGRFYFSQREWKIIFALEIFLCLLFSPCMFLCQHIHFGVDCEQQSHPILMNTGNLAVGPTSFLIFGWRWAFHLQNLSIFSKCKQNIKMVYLLDRAPVPWVWPQVLLNSLLTENGNAGLFTFVEGDWWLLNVQQQQRLLCPKKIPEYFWIVSVQRESQSLSQCWLECVYERWCFLGVQMAFVFEKFVFPFWVSLLSLCASDIPAKHRCWYPCRRFVPRCDMVQTNFVQFR